MQPNEIADMCRFSTEKARDELDTSQLLLDNKKFSKSLNCSYYAVFYAARALLLADGIQRRKHSGVVSEFIKQYVAAGKLDKKYSAIIKNAQKIRIESDYKFFYIVSREETIQQLKDARDFVDVVNRQVEEKLSSFPTVNT